MYHNFFIHSSVDGHLGYFHVLAIVNSVTMNSGTHVSFSVLVSSGYMPRGGIDGSYGGFIPSFLRHHFTVLHSSWKTAFLKEPEQWRCAGDERWELQGLVEAWPLIRVYVSKPGLVPPLLTNSYILVSSRFTSQTT